MFKAGMYVVSLYGDILQITDRITYDEYTVINIVDKTIYTVKSETIRPFYLQIGCMFSCGSQGNIRLKSIYFETKYSVGYSAEIYRKLPNASEDIKASFKTIEEDFKHFILQL